MASDPMTVLHLSDVQFGRHHRFESDEEGFDTLYQRLEDGLRGLAGTHGLHPNLVVVTGDLAESGLAKEFDEARRFLERLEGFLELPRRQIVVIPGNHDVNRKICQGYFAMCEGDEQKPQPPYWPKWKHYVGFFNSFYVDVPGVEFTEDEPWTLVPIDELRVVVAGLNSTMAESHRKKDHYGQVGEKQLRWFAEKLRPYQQKDWLQIGAVHHNPFRGAKKDDANLRDVDDFDRYLGPMLNLVLHGHTHEAKLQWLRPDVPVLAMGSAGVDAKDRPAEVPNQYQVVQIRGDGFRRFARCYAGDKKRWIGDTRISGDDWKDDHSVTFRDVAGTFEDAPAADKTDDEVAPFRTPKDDFPQDDFLARVQRICTIREKQGTKIRRVRDQMDYLSVTVAEGGGIVKDHLVAALEDVSNERFDAFLRIHRRYRRADPGSASTLVYADEIASDIQEQAKRERVHLQSFVEYQGLMDLRSYVENQTHRLSESPRYRPELYVEQQMSYRLGQEDFETDDALAMLRDWLAEERGRFILVLGDFGTGKTFLLRELARRLGSDDDGGIVPVFVELRALEKARNLDVLVGQHFLQHGVDPRREAFRYMLEQGRIVLLFDGFDELALRVTYERAVEHFSTLAEAARGNAKVVVTSRTQHFESDRQVRTALGEQVDILPGRRIVRLRGFDERRIRRFLRNQLGDETAAGKRFALLNEVKDLMGLSENPRMLGFISELSADELRQARTSDGKVTAANLYQALLDRWLGYEVVRQEPRGAPLALTKKQRWDAVNHLARCLWQRTDRSIHLSELDAEVRQAIEVLAEQHLNPDETAYQVGSGTLLVRDDEGAFSFIHQSVLEWLVARQAAEELKEKGSPEVLAVAEISPLMVDFFRDLAGSDRVTEWAVFVSEDDDEIVRTNALLVGKRLGKIARASMRGKNLRGRDFSRQVLLLADFSFADLTSASFVEATLTKAELKESTLVQANFSRAVLRGANLAGANLSEARFLGADLTGARLDGTIFRRTKLVGARLDTKLSADRLWGSAPPRPSAAAPWTWLPASPCNSVAWSPDGTFLATGHDDAIVRLWDTASGQEIRRFLGHQSPVRTVSFSLQGKQLASGSDDKTVRSWNVETGAEIQVLKGHRDAIRNVCFSRQGTQLASGSDDETVRLWDVKTGAEIRILKGHHGSVRSVCFSFQGKQLASGSDDMTVRLWNVETGAEVKALKGHRHSIRSVCLSLDGSQLASGSDDKTVRLWNVETGAETKVLNGHHGPVLSVEFSPQGDWLASGSLDKTVRLWDVGTGRELKILKGHRSPVGSVSFSPKGDRLCSGSHDNTIRLWAVESGTIFRTLEGHQNQVRSVDLSPRGAWLASGSYDNTVRLWKIGLGANTGILKGHESQVLSVCFSPQVDLLASGSYDRTVRLWNVETGREDKVLQGHQDPVWGVCFSPLGDQLASASSDRTIRLWDVRSGKTIRILIGHRNPVWSVCFSPRGNQLASGSYDSTIGLWDIESGIVTKVLKGHLSQVRSVCFSPQEDRLASASSDRTLRLWDVEAGSGSHVLKGHQGPIWTVCFSPQGDQLASGSSDNTVRLWDVETGAEFMVFQGHQNAVRSVCFSPQGDRLASGSDDNTIRIWDVKTGRCLAILVALPEGWVAYTPDGRYKVGGETSGGFWHSIGLCRFEVGELDPYMDLRVPSGEPLVPGLAGGGR